jgi:hypothetical protein
LAAPKKLRDIEKEIEGLSLSEQLSVWARIGDMPEVRAQIDDLADIALAPNTTDKRRQDAIRALGRFHTIVQAVDPEQWADIVLNAPTSKCESAENKRKARRILKAAKAREARRIQEAAVTCPSCRAKAQPDGYVAHTAECPRPYWRPGDQPRPPTDHGNRYEDDEIFDAIRALGVTSLYAYKRRYVRGLHASPRTIKDRFGAEAKAAKVELFKYVLGLASKPKAKRWTKSKAKRPMKLKT